jgi:citrate synthase
VLNIRGYPIEQIVSNLSFSETLYLTVRGELPTQAQLRTFDAALSALPDHGFLSTHAGAARFVASGWPSSPVPAIAAGLLCIGEVTISPQDTGQLITDGLAQIRDEGRSIEEVAAAIVDDHLSERRLLPGIGHPQHKDKDIRAVPLRRVAEEQGIWGDGGTLFDAVHAAFVERKGGFLPMNIDGVLGCVLHDLGFTPLQMPGIAAVAILPGLIAHSLEEINEGVPLRIIPHSIYSGPAQRDVSHGTYMKGNGRLPSDEPDR